VPYNSETGEWLFSVILSESNGVGITLTSIRFDSYNQEEQLYYTQILYEEDIIDWFGSNYLPASSSISNWIYYKSAEKIYDILTVTGVDNNDNPIKTTGKVDYLPKQKAFLGVELRSKN